MKKIILNIFFLTVFIFQNIVSSQPKNISIDASSDLGEFNLVVGAQGKPYNEKTDFVPLYKKLGFKIIRNHDFYGPTDWYEIFPDWGADAESESSYDFRSSDSLILALSNGGFEILFRLGSSWKGKNKMPVNDPPGTIRDKHGKVTHAADKKDFKKFAAICKHIVMHYNEGWASGHRLNIKKWEIWNEPSLTEQFWTGNYKQFNMMFAEVGKELKKYDPSLIIGGPAQEDMCKEPGFFDSLLAYCKRENAPLDFYSFHTYGGKRESMTPYESVNKYNEARKKLDKYGFVNTYIICDEYNCEPRGNNSNTPKAAAFIASFLSYSEKINIREAYFYRGDDHPMGLVDMKNGKEKFEALPFLAWKALTDNTIKLTSTGSDNKGFTVTASKMKSENKIFVLISNFTEKTENVNLVPEKIFSKSIKIVRKEIAENKRLVPADSKDLYPKKDGKYSYKFKAQKESVQLVEIEY